MVQGEPWGLHGTSRDLTSQLVLQTRGPTTDNILLYHQCTSLVVSWPERVSLIPVLRSMSSSGLMRTLITILHVVSVNSLKIVGALTVKTFKTNIDSDNSGTTTCHATFKSHMQKYMYVLPMHKSLK